MSGVAALSQKWRDQDVANGPCDFQDEDGVSDYGQRRALHEQLQREQYECNPPQEACTSLYNDYLFWLSSGEGQNCSKTIAYARAETDPFEAQAKYFAFCGTSEDDSDVGETDAAGVLAITAMADTGSSCASRIRASLREMMQEGCGNWPAFVAVAEDMDLLCTSEPNDAEDAAAAPTFCEPLYRATAVQLQTALDSTASVADREAVLGDVCTTCFNSLFRVKRQNARLLRRVYREPELCITDPTVVQLASSESIRYCLPRFEAAMASGDLNDQAAAACDAATMGRCAKLVWAHRLKNYDIDFEQGNLIKAYMVHMCVQNDDGDDCHAVTTELASGHYLIADAQEGRDCNPESTTGECVNPQYCQNWFDVEANANAVAADDGEAGLSCPHRCQEDVDNLVTKFGCCFNSWKLLLESDAGGNSAAAETNDELFARVEYLQGKCCSDEERGDGEVNTCKEPAPPACEPYPSNYPLSFSVPIPHEWAKQRHLSFNTSIVQDVSQALGLHLDSIKLDLVEPLGDGTQITLSVGSRSYAEFNIINQVMEYRMKTGTFFYDMTSQIYESADCSENPGTQYCNSAAQLASTLLSLTLLLMASMSHAT